MNDKITAWLKDNWFKLGILIILSVVTYSFYEVFVVNPRIEKEEQRLAREEQKFIQMDKEKKIEEEKLKTKSEFDKCMLNAELNYLMNWKRSCMTLGYLSKRCVDIFKNGTAFNDAYETYLLKHPNTDISQFYKIYTDCSCLLSDETAKRWDASKKDEENDCYKQNPQIRP